MLVSACAVAVSSYANVRLRPDVFTRETMLLDVSFSVGVVLRVGDVELVLGVVHLDDADVVLDAKTVSSLPCAQTKLNTSVSCDASWNIQICEYVKTA